MAGIFDSLGGLVMGLGSAYADARNAKRGRRSNGGLLTRYLEEAQMEEERRLAEEEEKRKILAGQYGTMFDASLRNKIPLNLTEEQIAEATRLGYNIPALSQTAYDTFRASSILPEAQMHASYGQQTPEAILNAQTIQDLIDAYQQAPTLERKKELNMLIAAYEHYQNNDAIKYISGLSVKERKRLTELMWTGENPGEAIELMGSGQEKYLNKVMRTGSGGTGGTGGQGRQFGGNYGEYGSYFTDKYGIGDRQKFEAMLEDSRTEDNPIGKLRDWMSGFLVSVYEKPEGITSHEALVDDLSKAVTQFAGSFGYLTPDEIRVAQAIVTNDVASAFNLPIESIKGVDMEDVESVANSLVNKDKNKVGYIIEEFVRANAIDGYDRTGEYASEIRQMLASMNPNDEKSKKEVASAIALILARMMNLKVKRARD